MMELAAMLKCSHAGLDEVLKDLASNLKHHNDNGDAVDFEIKSSDSRYECFSHLLQSTDSYIPSNMKLN